MSPAAIGVTLAEGKSVLAAVQTQPVQGRRMNIAILPLDAAIQSEMNSMSWKSTGL
jgi:hypothetical protein